MQIGDGATGTITRPLKQGGLVAIYYLGTLVGALMYDQNKGLSSVLDLLKLTVNQGRRSLRQDRTKENYRLRRMLGSLRIFDASGRAERKLDAVLSHPRRSRDGSYQRCDTRVGI